MTENEISYQIRGAIFNIYENLGPGLLESAYERTLIYELKKRGLLVESQVPIPIIYEEIQIESAFRLDLLINKKVIIEIKSVEKLTKLHHKQLITYLKLTGIKLGILVNFNSDSIFDNIIRKVNRLNQD
jgi:GxxExxY protein